MDSWVKVKLDEIDRAEEERTATLFFRFTMFLILLSILILLYYFREGL